HPRSRGTEVPAAIRSMDITAVRTAVGCPWQNGVAERWVGSCRRELLDHVIAINQSHLKRLLASYVAYYHQDRIHCGLQKQTPVKRTRCAGQGKWCGCLVSVVFTIVTSALPNPQLSRFRRLPDCHQDASTMRVASGAVFASLEWGLSFNFGGI